MRAGLMSAPSIARGAGMSAHGGSRSWGVPGQPPRWGMHPPSGAWQHERDEGIGHVDYTDHEWSWDHGSYGASLMRREASAMRSRAYERRWGTWEYKRGVEAERPDVRVDDWTHWISTDESTADHQAFQPRYARDRA